MISASVFKRQHGMCYCQRLKDFCRTMARSALDKQLGIMGHDVALVRNDKLDTLDYDSN